MKIITISGQNFGGGKLRAKPEARREAPEN